MEQNINNGRFIHSKGESWHTHFIYNRIFEYKGTNRLMVKIPGHDVDR